MSEDRLFLAGAVRAMAAGDRGVVDQQPPDAVRVIDGRISDVGNRHDLLADRASGTDIVDLGGATLLPGLVEPHTHPDLCAQMYSWVDVSGFTHSRSDGVEAALRNAIEHTAAGDWVFAFGLDFLLTEGLGRFDRDRLDRLAPENPVFIMIQSMHTAFANSEALRLAGVDEGTPDPAGGGHYDRDDAGRLTGRIEESPAMTPFVRHFDASDAALGQRLEAQYDRYAEVGITSIGVAGLFIPWRQFETYASVAADPNGPVRTTTYLRHQQANRLADFGDRGERFRIPGVKLWYDGSPYTGTMLLDEPYLDTELCCCVLGIPDGSMGRANFTPDDLIETLVQLAEGGWQLLTHAQGDRGCREILDLYETAFAHAQMPSASLRWRLEHCALITAADLERSATAGVAPSFHMNHVLHYGHELRDAILGPERAGRLMPMAHALDCGHRPSLHADSPMYPPGPLSLVRTAVTRLTRHGDQLGADQAVSLDAAMRAVTIDAAWQLRDDEGGSIEIGKRADFTVVAADPWQVEPQDLDQIDVIGTYLDGR